jgi:hypothetical protein
MIDCGHECYRIGGPWITYDPSCPVHGPGGSLEREEQAEATEAELRATISALEGRVARLEAQLAHR